MEIDINGVKITLTKDQLDEISRQTKKYKTINDVNDIIDACEVLNVDLLCRRTGETEDEWEGRQLQLIIRAANFIDNNYKEWTPDFTNTSEYKYIPYFERKKSGWVLVSVSGDFFRSLCPVWFYFKSRETTKVIVKRFIDKYNKYIG